MPRHPAGIYEFGPYRLDVENRVFTRDGAAVALPPKTFELLAFLVQRPGRRVSRQDLLAALWPDTFVEEANLTFQISLLRKTLGDTGARWIETVPKHGYRFTADVRIVRSAVQPLPTAVDGAGDDPAARTLRRAVSKKWVVALIGGTLLLAVTYLVLLWRTQPPATAPTVPVPLTAYPGFEGTPGLSPDGSQVAFTWNGPAEDNPDIYVKLVGPGQPLRLTTDSRRDDSAAWSPDGKFIAFQRAARQDDAEIFVVPALGGAERKVAVIESLGAQPRPRGNLAWSADGRWIAAGGRPSGEASTGIWLIGLDGAARRRITEIADLDAGDTSPAFSPDGRHLAFIRARKSAANAVYVQALSSSAAAEGAPIQVTTDNWNVLGLAWSNDGRSLVFSSAGHVGIPRLRRIAFNPRQPRPTDQPEILPFGEHATAVTISRGGRLVYATESRDSNVWRLSISDTGSGPSPVAPSTYDEHTPDYSPDGRRLAFASNRSGDEELWIADVDGSNAMQMTSMRGPLCANPRWSPDGETILFTSRRAGSQDLYLLSPRTGEIRQITHSAHEEVEPRWSRDGRWIYYGSNRTGRFEVWRISAAGESPVQITRHGGIAATESRDGRFLYYAKAPTSPTSIWRVPAGGGEERVVVDGLSDSKNFVVAQRGLYFLARGDSRDQTSIDFVEFATGQKRTVFNVGKPFWFGMAASPDGQALLYSVIDAAGGNLMLVEGFR